MAVSTPDLDDLRKAIDGIDQQLLTLLSERARHALAVGDVKKIDNAPVGANGRRKPRSSSGTSRESSVSNGGPDRGITNT